MRLLHSLTTSINLNDVQKRILAYQMEHGYRVRIAIRPSGFVSLQFYAREYYSRGWRALGIWDPSYDNRDRRRLLEYFEAHAHQIETVRLSR